MIVGCYSSNKTILTPNTYKYLVKGDQALLKGNYLSEFKTNTDKNKVLKNLGIVNPKWGNIEGNIEDQKDLMDKLKTSIVDNITSEKVSYDNNDYPELSNVKKALDQLLHKDLNIAISVNPSHAEKGDSIDKVTFSWTYNKSNITYQKFDNQDIDKSIRSFIITGPITNTIRKTIVGSDGTQQVQATGNLIFYNTIYYINSINQPNFEECSKQLVNSRSGVFTVIARDNEYIWFLIPSELGEPTFTVGIFSGGFYKYAETTYKGIAYNVYRSDNHSLGNTTINLS